MKFFLSICCLSLGAAQVATPEYSPEEFRRQMEKEYSEDPCLRKRDGYWEHIGWRHCLSFLPAERMHGVWYTGFEESGFVENVDAVPLTRDIRGSNPDFDISLDADTVFAEIKRKTGQPARHRCIRAFRLDFVGRRSASMGLKEGQISMTKQVIVIDRLVSAKYLGLIRSKGVPGYDKQCATPQPSAAEIKAMDAADLRE